MAGLTVPPPRPPPSRPPRAGPGRQRRLRAAAALSVVFTVLGPGLCAGGAAAQEPPEPGESPAVERVRLRVEAASGDRAPRVELEYRLRVPGGTREIPLHGLTFAGTAIGPVEAWLDGRPVEVSLRREERLVRSASVPLAPNGDPGSVLRLAYSLVPPGPGPATGGGVGTRSGDEPRSGGERTAGAPTFDLAVPLLRVDWAPADSDEETFRATVVLPADARLTERLPTVPLERTTAAGRAAFSFSLPAVPSLLRFRGRRGGAPLFTLGRWVDLGVLLALAVLGLAGWRAYRRRTS